MIRPSCLVWVGLVLIAAACSARASDADLRWFRSHWREAREYLPPPGVWFDFSTTRYSIASDEEVEAYRAQAEDEDARTRAIAQTMLRRAAKGSETRRMRLWFDGRDRWRLSSDYDAGRGPTFHDRGVRGNVEWSLSPQEIAVVDARYRPQNRAHGPSGWYLVSQHLIPLLTSGLNTGVLEGLAPESATRQGDGRWDAVVSGGDDWRRYRLGGAIRSDGSPEVREITLVEAPSGSAMVGVVHAFNRWYFDDVLEQYVAGEMTVRLPDRSGSVLSRVELVSVGTVERSGMDALLGIPVIGAEDRVRGALTSVRREYDFRPSSERMVLMRDGELQEHPMPDVLRPSHGASGRPLRLLGWVSAGLIIVILLGVRLWRARSAPEGKMEASSWWEEWSGSRSARAWL